MQAVAVFGGGGRGGGGGGGGGGGSMSTVSREENLVMSSEDSSSPDEGGELELGLGLSLGGRDGGFKGQQGVKVGRYARILTAKDLPSVVSAASSSSSSSATSSSSSSSVLSRANNNAATSGTKRSADFFAVSNGASSQVVGWPPIRAYRMNSMVNQVKSLATEEFNSMNQKNIGKNKVLEKADYAINGNAKTRTSLFVKVNMDGIPIGRKVDLKAHGGYEALSRALEDMFLRPSATVNGAPEHNMMIDAARRPRLLDGLSEFVLTYEDKEGDWMLVGDVPWGMFLGSVRRLRIMRTSEATGLGK